MNDQAARKHSTLFKRLDEVGDEQVVDLLPVESWPETRHRFHETDLWAIRSALAAERPLLLRGEPGIGKSQLARAAAQVLRVPFLYKVIDSRCECTELLHDYDAVSRLAKAQGCEFSFKGTPVRFAHSCQAICICSTRSG